jgi:glutamine cyclotransferase
VIIPRGYFRDDCKYSHDEVSFIDGLFDINDTLSLSAYHKGQNNDRLSVIGINEQEYDTILLHSSMLTNDEYFTEDGLMNWQIRVQRNITSGYHSGNR